MVIFHYFRLQDQIPHKKAVWHWPKLGSPAATMQVLILYVAIDDLMTGVKLVSGWIDLGENITGNHVVYQ